ncbi:MAG TPA: hypothetical protein VFI69_08230 [Candidatus Limnocylindrales bacterium]|nr:hypothetical protein [Candidatus Limnocylindrales bacterium]
MTASTPASGRRWAPGPKLTPKIILEGTRLTHKTDLAFALNEHPRIVGPRRYRYHSPVISGEWGSFHPYPWSPGLVDYGPEDRDRAMETYATWAHMFELQRHYSWMVDRFHLSTLAWQSIHRAVDEDFGWLEERLEPLGFHIVLCTRRADTFEAARAERLTVSGKPTSTTISASSCTSRTSSAPSPLRRGCRSSNWTSATATSRPRAKPPPTG